MSATLTRDARLRQWIASDADVLKVGPCSLRRDRDNDLIWGVDLYDREFVAANGTDPAAMAKALAWADAHAEPVVPTAPRAT